MAGGIPHLHRSQIIQLVTFTVHGKVTGIAHHRMLDHYVLVLPISDVQLPFLQRHFGIVSIRAQHAHIHIDMVPVVAGKALFVVGTHILGNKNLIVKLFLGSCVSSIIQTVPGNDQLDIRLLFRRFGRTVSPMLGIHVYGFSKIVISLLVNGFLRILIQKSLGILPVIDIGRSGGFTSQGGIFHAIHQINGHALEHGLPAGHFLRIRGIHDIHIVFHLQAHRQFAGKTFEFDGTVGHHNFVPAGDDGTSRHDEQVLDSLASEVCRNGCLQDFVQRRIFPQRAQHRFGRIDQRKDQSVVILHGTHRKNLGIHQVGCHFYQERGVALDFGFLVEMIAGRRRSLFPRVKVKVHPGDEVFVTGFVSRHGRSCVHRVPAPDIHFEDRAVPGLFLLLGTG